MITIGFSTDPKSWNSKLIRKLQGSAFSHTFFKLGEQGILGPVVMQADSPGVVITTYATFDFNRNPLVNEFIPIRDLTKAVRKAADLLNSAYDFRALLGMTFVEFWWHVFKRKVKNPWHAPGAFFCSAFVVKVLQMDGWPGAEQLDPASTDDQMLADFLKSNPALGTWT